MTTEQLKELWDKTAPATEDGVNQAEIFAAEACHDQCDFHIEFLGDDEYKDVIAAAEGASPQEPLTMGNAAAAKLREIANRDGWDHLLR